jgi:3-oxoacyl-[acyl-carrier protein] reductase
MNPAAIITGASRGIGRGIALELAGAGYDLMINYAGREEAARQTAADCLARAKQAGRTIQAEICQADVGRAEDRDRLMARAKSAFHRLDLLVNNAGITSLGRRDVLEAREEEFDRLMAVNLKGPYFLTQLAAHWMIDQTQAQILPPPRPKIVMISSISAIAVSTNRGDYCLAKAALEMMTKVYAVRLAGHGIRVFTIRPGVIESDMTAPVREKYEKLFAEGLAPIRRWGTPEDVGKAVAALAAEALPYSTGEVLNVDGGLHVRRL